MAAQEQTERATPAAPAPKQYFKGTVKQVLDGGAVVIRGVPKGGPPPERTLALTNINAPRLARRPNNQLPEGGKDEPFAWEAREFLRKLVVGKTVLGSVVHTANNRDYGTLCLGEDPTTGIDVALRLVEEGLATVRDNCYDEGLKSAMEVAKAAGKGLHAEGASSHVRDITWDLGEGGGLKLVEQHKGKPIKAVVEHVRDGTTLRLFLLPEMIHVTLQMSGLRSPQTKLGAEGKPDPAQCEPFAIEAHYYTESRLLQRDVEVVLESHSYNAMNKITTLVGSVIHPAGNIAEGLLREGMAKCVDWSISKVTGGPQKYREAEKLAKEKRVRMWRDYKPTESTLSDKEREFTGKVVEVVNGDALMVKAGGKVRKLHLASIRPPRPEDTDSSAKRGPDFRPLYDVPFMFEAREFLRKKLIGHQVQVTVDYVQAARTEPGQGSFPEKFCCTIMISGVNVAEALVSKGLATVVRYAQGNDDRSSKYDELLQAEEKAKKTGKGLHDKKNTPTHRVSDMTGKLEKCKQFLPFLKRAGKMQGLVEYVASGSRFRVYIPRETCIITFLLGGISCPRGSRQMPDGSKVEAEKFGDEAALHVKEMILQREVEIEVESQDKAGNFIGYLFCENQNLSVHLVAEGYASMHFTADRSNYCNQIQNAQDNAKSSKKRIWKDYVPEAAVEEVEWCPGSGAPDCRVMKVFLLTTLALTQARPRDPDHYLTPWQRVIRTVGSGRGAPLNVPTALRLEADEELNLIGSEDNNVAFELYEVKNGRTDDVMWEFGLGDVKRGEKEEEVREAEEKQIKNLKALVNLKLPGAFMGESEVLQEAMEEKKEEAKQESKASRWEKARPRSLEYYNQFIDTREIDESSKGGDVYIVAQCCHEVNIQGR